MEDVHNDKKTSLSFYKEGPHIDFEGFGINYLILTLQVSIKKNFSKFSITN